MADSGRHITTLVFDIVHVHFLITMADSGRRITTSVFDIVHVHFLINVHVQCQFHFF